MKVIFEDDHLLVVHKPNDLLTHRTPMNKGERDSLLNRAEDLLDQKLFTLHRLDKSTSGLVCFAKDSSTAKSLSLAFKERTISKTYLALVRGFAPTEGINDRPLRVDETSPWKGAVTEFRTLKQVEIDTPVSRYSTSRYSLLEVYPKTGRYHQIRKHMAQLRHYIVGDKRHGDVKHNKAFEHTHQCKGLFLHAYSLRFNHPLSNESIEVRSLPEGHWLHLKSLFGWELGELTDVTK